MQLPEDTLQRADAVADLWAAVQRACGVERPVSPAAARSAVLAQPAPGGDAADIAANASTLLEVLDAHLRVHPERVQATVLADGSETPMSYGGLTTPCRRWRPAGCASASRRAVVAIMLPTSIDYFVTFFGVLLAGAVPVPIYPPARPSQLEDHLRRHTRILDNAQVAALVTVPEAVTVGRLLRAKVMSLRHVLTAAELPAPEGQDPRPRVAAHDLALLQYTSGSTGDPKGVTLTHANLLANIRAMGEAVRVDASDVFVSWLPLYHDMGLIGAWLGSLTLGCPLVVMSPLSFLARPARWLWAIHDAGGTLSAAPNFGYELCLAKVADAEIAGVDLSSLRFAFNGAEPVSPETLERFNERFARFGLRPDALAPVYGLAENSVGLTFPPPGRGWRIDSIDRDRFVRDGRAVSVDRDHTDALRVAACGSPIPGHQIRLVDAVGTEVGARQEGRIEFRGPSATSGYFRNPDATARLFDGDWLDTGDLGYVADGDLYVTGRVKDLIIRGGRNLHPEELELAVGEIPGIRRGRVAVFGVPDHVTGTERLVVEAETREADAGAREALRHAVTEVAVDLMGTPPDEVVLARPGSVLKTSSGKIRRAASRDLYERGELAPGPASARLQFLRLAGAAVGHRLRWATHRLGHFVFGLWASVLFWLLAPPFWLLCVLMPTPAAAWRVARVGARTLLRGAGVRLTVRGLEHLPDRPAVLVCNHASYIDGLVLVAALPRPCSFVAKHELAGQWIAGTFLRRLGTLFVERVDRRRSVEDAQQLAVTVAQGQSLLVFPEGSFKPEPGLLPFHLGAFAAAVEAGVPGGARSCCTARANCWPIRTGGRDLQRWPSRSAPHCRLRHAMTALPRQYGCATRHARGSVRGLAGAHDGLRHSARMSSGAASRCRLGGGHQTLCSS